MSQSILGESDVIVELKNLIRRVAQSKTNILIIGESGTGKELVARMIHEIGPFHDQPFVPVNCGAIPINLIETEMFGHQKGSFTGAVSEKVGLFEVAHRGTLFLDEVGELPLAMQVKLLRAIQERSFRRVGGIENIRVDVRIIAATNRDLEAAVRAGTFREDLFYRLNVILIKTPPLRERRGDVALLANHFLKQFAKRTKKSIEGFDPETLEILETYHWPGNVRELQNIIERAVTLESGSQIDRTALPEEIQKRPFSLSSKSPISTNSTNSKKRSSASEDSTPEKLEELRLPAADFSKGNLDLDQILGEVERTYILAALQYTRGRKIQASELLGITFRSLRYRLAKLEIKMNSKEKEKE